MYAAISYNAAVSVKTWDEVELRRTNAPEMRTGRRPIWSMYMTVVNDAISKCIWANVIQLTSWYCSQEHAS